MDEPPRSWSPGSSTRSDACRSRRPLHRQRAAIREQQHAPGIGGIDCEGRPPLIRRRLKLERQPAVPAVGALEEACLESVGMQRADHKRQQPVRVQGIKQQPRAARAPSSADATSPAAANRSATTTPHRRFTRPITARTPSDLAGALDSRGSSLKYVALSDDTPSHQFESCSPRPRARSVSAFTWRRPPQRAL